jgi:hypothetical protein
MKLVHIGRKDNATKKCVISLGVGKPVFKLTLQRLGESLKRVGFDGDYLYWDESLPSGCPDQFEAPFAFKGYCFNKAKELGYEQVLWIDAPCVAIRNLAPVFRSIEQHGYIFFNNNYGQMMGQWSSDDALAMNKISREEALAMPEIPCSVLGLNLRSDLASSFLEGWHQIMADGITARGITEKIKTWDEYQDIFWNRNSRISKDPRVGGHRCDQVAAGIVAYKLGMKPYSDLLRDIHFPEKPIKLNTTILHYREFGESIASLNDIYWRIFVTMPLIEKPRSTLRRLLGLARNAKSLLGQRRKDS